jgi:hypothetical protein
MNIDGFIQFSLLLLATDVIAEHLKEMAAWTEFHSTGYSHIARRAVARYKPVTDEITGQLDAAFIDRENLRSCHEGPSESEVVAQTNKGWAIP